MRPTRLPRTAVKVVEPPRGADGGVHPATLIPSIGDIAAGIAEKAEWRKDALTGNDVTDVMGFRVDIGAGSFSVRSSNGLVATDGLAAHSDLGARRAAILALASHMHAAALAEIAPPSTPAAIPSGTSAKALQYLNDLDKEKMRGAPMPSPAAPVWKVGDRVKIVGIPVGFGPRHGFEGAIGTVALVDPELGLVDVQLPDRRLWIGPGRIEAAPLPAPPSSGWVVGARVVVLVDYPEGASVAKGETGVIIEPERGMVDAYFAVEMTSGPRIGESYWFSRSSVALATDAGEGGLEWRDLGGVFAAGDQTHGLFARVFPKSGNWYVYLDGKRQEEGHVNGSFSDLKAAATAAWRSLQKQGGGA